MKRTGGLKTVFSNSDLSLVDLETNATKSAAAMLLQSFSRTLFRQPSLAEGRLKPAPYRVHTGISPMKMDIERSNSNNNNNNNNSKRAPLLGELDANTRYSEFLDPDYDEELNADEYEIEQEVSAFLEDATTSNNNNNNDDDNNNNNDNNNGLPSTIRRPNNNNQYAADPLEVNSPIFTGYHNHPQQTPSESLRILDDPHHINNNITVSLLSEQY
jgi:hypothetical protein